MDKDMAAKLSALYEAWLDAYSRRDAAEQRRLQLEITRLSRSW